MFCGLAGSIATSVAVHGNADPGPPPAPQLLASLSLIDRLTQLVPASLERHSPKSWTSLSRNSRSDRRIQGGWVVTGVDRQTGKRHAVEGARRQRGPVRAEVGGLVDSGPVKH